MKKNNRYIATLLLFLVSAGFLLSYPFSHTFFGGLLTALFGASMIGGIADWFGVTALFRKPLGIPFKTAIIPRSRERISEELVHMVENELLSKDALKSKLDRFQISERLIYYLDEQDGKKDLATLANRIVSDMLESMDPHKAGQAIEKILQENTGQLKVSPLFLHAAEWLAAHGTDDRIVTRISDEMKDFLLAPGINAFIGSTIEKVYEKVEENTEKETAGKRLFFKLVFTLVDFSDMSPAKLSSRLQTEVLEYLNQLKNPESRQRKGLEAWLEKNAAELKSNPSLHEKVDQKALDMVKKASLSTTFTKYVYPHIKNEEQAARLQGWVEELIGRLVENFRNSPEDQARLDAYIKNTLAQLIEESHPEIGRMVRQKLTQFSNEQLVEMIEEKAGNDLQIIRINGSVVGGLVGLAIYLMTFWVH